MKSKTYTQAREKLAEIIERVCEDHEPYIITKRRDKAVVMMSLEDFDSLKETAYLLKGPKNARRLLESIKQLEEGQGTERELVEWKSFFPPKLGKNISTGKQTIELF